MKAINPLNMIDFYKVDHRRQYKPGTSFVYSNMTARSKKYAQFLNDDKIVVFGVQYFVKHFLEELWKDNFFDRPLEEVVSQYKRRIDNAIGKDCITYEHIEELHGYGKLPIKIKALEEGSCVGVNIPFLTICNTHEKFYWLVNYIETQMSCALWKSITNATIARQYAKILNSYESETSDMEGFYLFQGHDFSARGLSSPYEMAISGASHLTSFCGTDTVLAIDLIEQYYNGDSDKQLIGASVPATEHSVMCSWGDESEEQCFKYLVSELYKTGIVSIVSDTWDFWSVLTELLPKMKNHILAREGKVVIRPDSGDPVDIICGDRSAPEGSPENKGAIEVLEEVFGSTINSKGYKQLNEKIGLIYGDSITLDRCESILSKLKEKGYSSSNVVFGIGSYTYNSSTRDTLGMAIKSTYCEIEGKPKNIFKDPKTDTGKMKKSAKGLLRVDKVGNEYLLKQEVSKNEEGGDLKEVFNEGLKEENLLSFEDIRSLIKDSLI